ncbi:trypsin-like peptidase domain-containing protein [Demequina litorisediminis]|uniref:Uncharacterized protein n=1 Tax=Demequina litorisediminis TaxID=1849022 RepID=A0ABQ6I8E0_9MICO|nr:trypsin-like peptidase domain-containing protein [Demequina litorisediminis]GMA34088.1 hypothetical protein GCM10025876_02920 [Demequina litorisediminis]
MAAPEPRTAPLIGSRLYRDLYESLQEQGDLGTQQTPDQGDTWSGNTTPGGNGYSGGVDGYGTEGGTSDGLSGLGGLGSTTTQEEATTASDAESTGIVLIDTVLGYQSAEAAGSGMVLTEDGLILTNNHVVEGATDITVTIGSTGQTYTANVIGTDSTEDVALLQARRRLGIDHRDHRRRRGCGRRRRHCSRQRGGRRRAHGGRRRCHGAWTRL